MIVKGIIGFGLLAASLVISDAAQAVPISAFETSPSFEHTQYFDNQPRHVRPDCGGKAHPGPDGRCYADHSRLPRVVRPDCGGSAHPGPDGRCYADRRDGYRRDYDRPRYYRDYGAYGGGGYYNDRPRAHIDCGRYAHPGPYGRCYAD